MLVDFGNSDSSLEKVEGGAEAGLHVAGKEAGAAMDDVAEGVAGDAGLAEEEGEDGNDGGGFQREDVGAHGGDAAEVCGGEIGGGSEE